MMNYPLDCFSPHYAAARGQFLDSCRQIDGALNSYENVIAEMNQQLVTDVFWLGPEHADNLLVLISATHGVEGYCGSAAQIDFLRHTPDLDSNTAALLIHAINPFGFAFNRRVNEDNIDLNRNFVDFTNLPVNKDYQLLAPALSLRGLDERHLTSSRQQLKHYRQQWGDFKYEQAVSGGQYGDAGGLFYGGKAPSWSHQLISQLISEYDIDKRKKVIVLDIHSGLGPYGYGEVISDHKPGSEAAQWARQCFSDNITEPAKGTSSSVPKLGLMDYLWHQHLPQQGCYITLEFGSYAIAKMFSLLQQENYCWQHAVSEEKKQTVQQALRHYFYPEQRDWQEMVLFRSRQIIRMAITGLKNE